MTFSERIMVTITFTCFLLSAALLIDFFILHLLFGLNMIPVATTILHVIFISAGVYVGLGIANDINKKGG